MRDFFLNVCVLEGNRPRGVVVLSVWANLMRVCKSGEISFSETPKTTTTLCNFTMTNHACLNADISVMFEYCLSVSLSGGESCSRSAGLRHGSGVSAASRLCSKQGQIHPKISRWDSRILYDCLDTHFWGFFNHGVWRQSPYEHMNYMLFHFFCDLMFSTMMT